MKVDLAYGDGWLEVEVPADRTTVVVPEYLPPAPDAYGEVRRALRNPVSGPPLRARVHRGQAVAISVCDGTRPQPRKVVVPAILEELEGIVAPEDVVVLVATGTHRGNTQDELTEMLGDTVVSACCVLNHDARDDQSLAWVGRIGANVPVWLNRRWLEADFRITTGVVEPHFFAGFSGGPKMVAPGLAGLETVLTLHDAARIAHPSARWGITHGNPIHDDVRAIATATGVDFSLDVILDADKHVVQAFGGDALEMHAVACEAARRASMRALAAPFDVVVTSNSGYPLDQNLYQAVKGIAAAASVVKDGGTIVCAAECRDGFPDHGSYRTELVSAASTADLLSSILGRKHTVPDQWQLQIQAAIQLRAHVVMHTTYLSDDELADAHLEQTHDIGRTISEVLEATGGRLCVLPEGPRTIPYVVSPAR